MKQTHFRNALLEASLYPGYNSQLDRIPSENHPASDVVLRARSESYFDLNSTEVQLNHSFHSDDSYLLVMVTTIEAHDAIDMDVRNTLVMMEFFQKQYAFRAVVFSRSQSVIVFCREHHITCITDYASNPFHMPLIRFFLLQAQHLFPSRYYGYINSDILLSSSLFAVLSQCTALQTQGTIRKRFVIAGRVRNVDDSRIPDLLHTNLSISAYESLLLSMTDNKKARLRHHHSADYFVFSSSIDFTLFEDAVIGRGRIDNYLMEIPDRQGGSLIDSSYKVLGVHQGLCGYKCRNRKRRQEYDDYNWNEKYVRLLQLGYGTLVTADYRL